MCVQRKTIQNGMLIMSLGAIDNEHLALNLYLRQKSFGPE